MKNAKILSPLRFYKNLILKRKDSAMIELEKNWDYVFFIPILSLLLIIILSLIIFQNAFALMILVVSLLFIIGHALITSQVNTWISNEKERIRKEREELRKEAERLERERKRREYQEAVEKIYRDHFRREAERQQRREQERREEEARRKAEYEKQKNSVDQNIINAMKLMGLQKGFTVKDLKSAYRKLSKVHHPDAGGLEANFKKLNTAYNYLMERM